MELKIRELGLSDYENIFMSMKAFTAQRDEKTTDEVWLTQHFPVFTQGQAGRPEHLLRQSDIQVVQSDRGGQITYHGPGQIVVYTLIDIKRAGLGIRKMVSLLEDSIIATLADISITANADPEAPGVYVGGKKIASLGLRVRQGRTYHGLALNVDMDLSPFRLINPCGYKGLQMTQISEVSQFFDIQQLEKKLTQHIHLGFLN